MIFKDRYDAADKLAEKLGQYRGATNTVILAIPRGALQIGYRLSQLLDLPLDIIATKKIPAPGDEELAIGSVGPDGEVLIDLVGAATFGVDEAYIQKEKKRLQEAIQKRYKTYRRNLTKPGESPVPDVKGKTVILVDDGIATGATMKAAIAYLRRQKAGKLIVAVPVAAMDTVTSIKTMVDDCICLSEPIFFGAVGSFYESFPQVVDDEAINLLEKAAGDRITK